MVMKVYLTVWYKPWNYIRHWWFMRGFKIGTTLTTDRLEPGESIILNSKNRTIIKGIQAIEEVLLDNLKIKKGGTYLNPLPDWLETKLIQLKDKLKTRSKQW